MVLLGLVVGSLLGSVADMVADPTIQDLLEKLGGTTGTVENVYVATEVPKGELGFYIVSEGGKSPYRCRIRSSAFNNLASLAHQVRGARVGGAVASIGQMRLPWNHGRKS